MPKKQRRPRARPERLVERDRCAGEARKTRKAVAVALFGGATPSPVMTGTRARCKRNGTIIRAQKRPISMPPRSRSLPRAKTEFRARRIWLNYARGCVRRRTRAAAETREHGADDLAPSSRGSVIAVASVAAS